MYALVVHDTITTTKGALPPSARRLDTREWVMGLPSAPVDLQEATGWLVVKDTPKPADTATDTYDRTVVLVNGVPTETWTKRPKTQNELNAETASKNQTAIQTNLEQDLLAMQAILDATNATINSNPAAHIKNIARMCKRLGRTATQSYESAD